MGELHRKYHHVCVCDLDRACAFRGGRLGLKELLRPKAPRTRCREASRP